MDLGSQDWLSLWPYAVLVSVVSAWALFHFLAPASWGEWAGAGLVQGFVIALYAEMYGFPLTLYLLAAALQLEIPLLISSGHLWATLLGYGSVGAASEHVIAFVFMATGFVLVVKGWVRIYCASGDLETRGVYGIVRHPQYIGIFLVIFGQLVDWPTLPTLMLAPAIVATYVLLARQEEARLFQQFGNRYRTYRRQVPMFVPRWRDICRRIAAV
jgi:protein-S-isoprenylcysteine O-methyltransferase Ste14